MLDEIPSNKTDHPQVTEHSLSILRCQAQIWHKQSIFIRYYIRQVKGEIWVVTMVTWMIETNPNFEFTRFSKNPVIIFSYFLDETT